MTPPGTTVPSATATYATRRSALALAQCREFIDRLRGNDLSVAWHELQVTTSGDRILDRPLSEVGGKGLFVKEIEEALLEGRADLAVHSMKDLPGTLPAGLAIACVPAREDARDALVAPRYGSLESLPGGARIGTSSLRRAVCLRALRPDLVIKPLRGNVDTRLRKLDAGEYDAIVLAEAGLRRLGLSTRTTELLPLDTFVPAPGQGALAIECREDDKRMRRLLAPLHDRNAWLCVAAERGVLIALGGDCQTPLGAHATRAENAMRLRAFVSTDPSHPARFAEQTESFPATELDAHAFGVRMGRTLTV